MERHCRTCPLLRQDCSCDATNAAAASENVSCLATGQPWEACAARLVARISTPSARARRMSSARLRATVSGRSGKRPKPTQRCFPFGSVYLKIQNRLTDPSAPRRHCRSNPPPSECVPSPAVRQRRSVSIPSCAMCAPRVWFVFACRTYKSAYRKFVDCVGRWWTCKDADADQQQII